MKRATIWTLCFLLALAGLGVAVAAWRASRPKLVAVVHNVGEESLRSVTVHVTGRSYDLGDLATGGTASVVVEPTSESGLEVEFTDSQGKRKRLNAGGYFEPGCHGTIEVKLTSKEVVDVRDDVTIAGSY